MFNGCHSPVKSAASWASALLSLWLVLLCSVASFSRADVHTQTLAQAPVHGVTGNNLRAQINKAVMEGRWLVDVELLQSENVSPNTSAFLPIWQNNTAKRAQLVRLALTEQQFANAVTLNQERGYRLLTHKPYQTQMKSQRILAIWVEHDTNLSRFSSTLAIESRIKRFLSETADVDLSITAYKQETQVFTRAYSSLNDCLDCDRLSASSPFDLGEVSQAIAGILAAKLEYRQRDHAGIPFNLSLNWPTRELLLLLPPHHSHRAVDLLSHTSCIPSEWNSASLMSVSNRVTASYYIEQTWHKPLIPGCAPGLLERRSASAFLYLAAFIEAATGRSSSELVREELAQPFRLFSLAVTEASSPNVLGTGLVASSADIAALLAGVLKGEVLPHRVTQRRLWHRQSVHNNYSFGWQVKGRGQVIAEHSDEHKKAVVLVDRRSKNILVILLRGTVASELFNKFRSDLLDML